MRPRRRAGPPPAAGPLDLFGQGGEAAPRPPRIEPPPIFEEQIPGAAPSSAVSISTLTQTARDVLEGAFVPLWVRGEVSDFKAHRNGHWYFCLRDERAQIRCVVWSRDQYRIPASPDEGMQVTALGQLTVYTARGEMQFSIKAMEAKGDGLWRKAVQRTLAALERDGLLAQERKRPLPRFPRRIAVVTSASGAAIRDIISVAHRRSPAVEIVVVPAKVQGEGAPEELCAAIDRACRWGAADALIIGRGGGGREDLWAFNDERVARAVAACPMPTISAVGHEVDVTVCDLVADLRAATPSAAAEAAVPLHAATVALVRSLAAGLRGGVHIHTAAARERLSRASREVSLRALRATERRRAALQESAARLNALSPLGTLARGYALAQSATGATLTRARDFAPGAPFSLRVHDGIVHAAVERVERLPDE